MGGLGNQLFQLAFALCVADGKPVVLEDWMGNTRKNRLGQPQLCDLRLPEQVKVHMYSNSPISVRRVINLGLRFSSRNKKGRLALRTFEILASAILSLAKGPFPVRFSRGLGFDSGLGTPPLTYHACGYFQTYQYASEPKVLEKLKNLTPLHATESLPILKHASDAIMLHVRLTDYLENSPFGLLGVEYYELSIRHLLNVLGPKKIHVFSDDPDSALSRLPVEFADLYELQHKSDDASHVLHQMRGYGGYIIANSSLSWWAAFLRFDGNAPVVCPDPWFKALEHPTDLLPNSWTRMPSNFTFE
jgi:hypothetical protein